MFKRVPGGAKPTESSSKSSSTEGRAALGEVAESAEGGSFPNRRSYGTQVPLVAGGLIVGILSLGRTNQGLSPTNISALRNPLAVPASVAIQNARIHETRGNLCRRARASPRRTQNCPAGVATRIEKPIE